MGRYDQFFLGDLSSVVPVAAAAAVVLADPDISIRESSVVADSAMGRFLNE
jgi:hypothetical protein